MIVSWFLCLFWNGRFLEIPVNLNGIDNVMFCLDRHFKLLSSELRVNSWEGNKMRVNNSFVIDIIISGFLKDRSWCLDILSSSPWFRYSGIIKKILFVVGCNIFELQVNRSFKSQYVAKQFLCLIETWKVECRKTFMVWSKKHNFL